MLRVYLQKKPSIKTIGFPKAKRHPELVSGSPGNLLLFEQSEGPRYFIGLDPFFILRTY